MTPRIDTFVLGDYQTNCHVVTIPDDPQCEGKCWIVDCGYEPQEMIEAISAKGLQPQAIFLTHCHSDHIAGIDDAMARFGPLSVTCHVSEEAWNMTPELNLSGYSGRDVRVTPPDRLVTGGESVTMGSTSWDVVHAPGHSPGCVLFVHEPSQTILAGDTLFAGSIGRCDFPTADPEAHRKTITMMMEFDDSYRVLPGHGPETTIGKERQTNPFVINGMLRAAWG
jgi:hydroxyacylglutathione hydrolase